MLKRFLRDESGATAIEYALIATIISLAIIGGTNLVADQVGTMFTNTGASVSQAMQ